MTESIDDLFTPKHKRLDRISSMANIFAWVVLIFYILQALLEFFQLAQYQGVQTTMDLFLEYPETAVDFFLSNFNILLRGVVYWITLKGISIGINMILETDLNYREKFQGENNEQ